MIKQYEIIFEQYKQKNKLKDYQFAVLREENRCYVTDLLQKHSNFIKEILENEGIIMICGSLSMYNDIMNWIDSLSIHSSEYYKANQQILADCY